MVRALEWIIEKSPAIAVLWRREDGAPIEYISSNIRRFGYEPEDFTKGGRIWLDIVHPDDRERINLEAKALLRRGVREYRQRYRILTRAGEVRWIDDLTFAPDDEAGPGLHIQGVLVDITEQQSAEDELRRSEERYRSVVEDQTELICRFKPDTTLTFVNQAYCRSLGKKRGELEGRRFMDFVAEEDRPAVLERLASLGAATPSVTYQHRVLDREGRTLWQEWTDRALTDEAGQVTEFQSVGRDITHLKAVEGALRESEERYRSLFGMVRLMCDNVPDLIWAKDLEKRYIFANRAMCERLLGALTTSEPVGKTDMFFAVRERAMHPGTPDWHTFGEICADSDTDVIAGRRPMRFDEYGNVKGKFLFLDVHKAPFWDEQGNLIGTVGCGRDVTREREMEKRRRAAEAEAMRELAFRKAMENSIEAGVAAVDVEGRHTYLNAAFSRMVGWTAEELEGQMPPFSYWAEEDSEAIHETLRAILRGEPPEGGTEVLFKRKDGQRVRFHLVASPLRDASGGLLGWMALIREITQPKATGGSP